MKNPALKIVLCLIMCIPLVAAILVGMNISENGVDKDDIPGRTLVVKYENTVQLATSDSEDLTVYDAVLANAAAISEPRSDLEQTTSYVVELAEADGTKKFNFYMSENPHNCVFADSEGNFSGMTPSDAEKLLARTEFAYVYAAETLPGVSYTCNVEVGGTEQSRTTELESIKYNWNVKLANGEFKQCSYDSGINVNDSESYIKLSEGGTYSFTFTEQPDSVTLKLSDEEKTIFSGSPEEFTEDSIAINKKNDTWLTIELVASYLQNDSREYSGEVTYAVRALYDVPTTYKSQDKSVGIGEFTIVEIYNANPGESISLTGTMHLAEDVRVQENNGGYFAIVPADLKCTADKESSLTFTSSDWGQTKLELPIRDKGAFDSIKLNSSAAALNFTDAAKQQFLDAVNGVLPTSERKKYWANEEDDFVVPCGGDYSNFGRKLIIGSEDEEDSNYVSNIGIDIYAAEGTPVNPTHNGRVAFAGELALSGNTIIIDHGYDIFSYYFHLGSINCAVGDIVSKSSAIGTVGTTGYTVEDTPYLLFAVSVGSTYTNPTSVFKYGVKIPE